jgi:hypothetical protein
MENCDILLATPDGLLGSYYATGMQQPVKNTDIVWAPMTISNDTKKTSTKPSWSKIRVIVKRAHSATGSHGQAIKTTGSDATKFILAWSDSKPDSGKDNIKMHDPQNVAKGVMDASFFAAAADNGNSTTPPKIQTADEPEAPIWKIDLTPDVINILHGSLMFAAWGVCPFIGIFIVRTYYI